MRRCLILFLLLLVASGCLKYRESQRSRPLGTCSGPEMDPDLFFQASTHEISFSGGITSVEVSFEWALTDTSGNNVVFEPGFLRSLVLNPDGLHPVELTAANAGRYSWSITRAGTFRATLTAVTCQGKEIMRQEIIVVKVTFAPIFTIEFMPSLQFSINVGTKVTARMSVADRDGSRRFQVAWDFSGDGRTGSTGRERWNLDNAEVLEKSYTYSRSGILAFSAVVTDEQGDSTRFEVPVLVGAPIRLLSTNSGNVEGSAVAPLSVTSPSRSRWAVASLTSGMRVYELEGDGVHVRSLGQFYDNERPGLLARGIAVDTALGIGYLAVADEGVYIVDIRNPDRLGFFNPPLRFAPSSRVGMAVDITQVKLVDHGRFLLIGNRATSELYIVRVDRVVLKLLLSTGASLASGYCEITNGGLAFPCAPDSQLLAPPKTGVMQSVAWIPPYLGLTGGREKFLLYRADQALTSSTPAGGYSMTEIDTGLLPTAAGNLYENSSSALTGQTLVSPPDTVELYVGHRGHGMALYRISTTDDVLTAPEPPYDNFYIFRKKGLLSGRLYDSVEQLYMDRGRVVIGEFGGGSGRSSLLLFNPVAWYARPVTWGYFYYGYVQKCNKNDFAGFDFAGYKLYEELKYLEDCIAGDTPVALAVTSGEAAVVSLSSLEVVALGAPAAPFGGSVVRAKVQLAGDLFGYDVSDGTAVLARGAAGVELWRLGDVIADKASYPRLYDGWAGNEYFDSVQFATGGTSVIWAVQERRILRYETGAFGQLQTAPTAQQTFAWVPHQLLFGGSHAWSIAGNEGPIVAYQISPLPITANGIQTVSDKYIGLVTAGTGQLLATRSLADGVQFDLLSTGSLAILASRKKLFKNVMPRAAMNQRGDLLFVLTVNDANESEVIALETWQRSGSTFERKDRRVIPVSARYALESLEIQAKGDLVGILLKGRDRGMFFFQADTDGRLAYVGANLTMAAYRMTDFRLFDAAGDLGILAHATDGANGGSFNLFRMKLGN